MAADANIVIALGQEDEREMIAIERIATRASSADASDEVGCRGPVVAPPIGTLLVPFDAAGRKDLGRAHNRGIAATFSDDDGNYACNHAFLRTDAHARDAATARNRWLVHVPRVVEPTMGKGSASKHKRLLTAVRFLSTFQRLARRLVHAYA